MVFKFRVYFTRGSLPKNSLNSLAFMMITVRQILISLPRYILTSWGTNGRASRLALLSRASSTCLSYFRSSWSRRSLTLSTGTWEKTSSYSSLCCWHKKISGPDSASWQKKVPFVAPQRLHVFRVPSGAWRRRTGAGIHCDCHDWPSNRSGAERLRFVPAGVGRAAGDPLLVRLDDMLRSRSVRGPRAA